MAQGSGGWTPRWSDKKTGSESQTLTPFFS